MVEDSIRGYTEDLGVAKRILGWKSVKKKRAESHPVVRDPRRLGQLLNPALYNVGKTEIEVTEFRSRLTPSQRKYNRWGRKLQLKLKKEQCNGI